MYYETLAKLTSVKEHLEKMSNPESELEETENVSAGKKVSIYGGFCISFGNCDGQICFSIHSIVQKKKNSVFRPWFHNF